VIAFLNLICRGIGSKTRYQIVTQQVDDNLVDAAIAQPLRAEDLTDEILELGVIRGVREAELGTALRKSGRTTGLTSGEVLQTDVTVEVSYGAGRTARFTDQLLAGPMSQGGDSGSAVLDNDNNLIGLLFSVMPAASIQDVKRKHEAELMAMRGVVSVGLGRDERGGPIIVVGIDRERRGLRARLPGNLEGYDVRVVVVGTVGAQ
jgi:hypothetical protein